MALPPEDNRIGGYDPSKDPTFDERQKAAADRITKEADRQRRENQYDKTDMVRRDSVLIAGSMKLAAYKVRDPETGEWSDTQFHMIYDNTVLAVMGKSAAELFAKFVLDIAKETEK